MNATCKAVGLVCALTAAAACGGEAPKTVLERLVCHDLPVSQCAAAIMGERQQNINILVELAGREGQGRRYKVDDKEFVEYPMHDTKHVAMLLLGDLRAAEGVSVLLRDIEYRVPKTPSGGYELGLIEGPGWHPAVESLIKIGMPSVGPVIEKLGGYAENCLGRRLCLVVLRGILGPQLAAARLQIAVSEIEQALAKGKFHHVMRTGRPLDEAKAHATLANLKAALHQLESQAKADRGLLCQRNGEIDERCAQGDC